MWKQLDKQVYTKISKEKFMFHISSQAKYTYFHERLRRSIIKNMYDIYRYK